MGASGPIGSYGIDNAYILPDDDGCCDIPDDIDYLEPGDTFESVSVPEGNLLRCVGFWSNEPLGCVIWSDVLSLMAEKGLRFSPPRVPIYEPLEAFRRRVEKEVWKDMNVPLARK